jgi:hypothetical protein
MASVVSILVAGRNTTGRTWDAVRRSSGAAFTAITSGARNVSTSLSRISPVTLQATARGAADLSRQADDAADQVQRLERFVRSLGGAASPALERQLADARREAERLSRAARQADRDLRRMSGRNRRLETLSRITGRFGDIMTAVGTSVMKFSVAGMTAIPIVSSLVYVLGSLLPLVLFLPAALAAGAAGLAVFKLGLHGVSDALKAGLEGDIEAFDKAMKKLAPNAQKAVKALVHVAKAWRETRKNIQQALFADMDKEIHGLTNGLRPIADTWLTRIASAANRAGRELAHFLNDPAQGALIDGILRNVHRTLDSIFQVGKPIASMLLDIMSAASPRMANGAEGLLGWLERLAAKVRELRESGKLGEWMDRATETLGKFKAIAVNIGGVLSGMFKAGSEGGKGFLDTLVDATAELKKFFNSEDGQRMIKMWSTVIHWIFMVIGWISSLNNSLDESKGFWQGLGRVIAGFYNHTISLTQVFITTVLNLLIGNLLRGAAIAFGWIPGLGPKLQEASAKFDKFVNDVNNQLNRMKTDVVINVRYNAERAPNVLGSTIPNRSIKMAPSGGIRTGLVRVGEHGTELLDLGARGGRVLTHNVAQRAGNGGSGGGGHVTVEFVIPPNVGSSLVAGLVREIASHVRTRAFGDVSTALGGI